MTALQAVAPAATTADPDALTALISRVVNDLVEEGRAKHRTLNDDQQSAADAEARAFYRKVIDRYRAALPATDNRAHHAWSGDGSADNPICLRCGLEDTGDTTPERCERGKPIDTNAHVPAAFRDTLRHELWRSRLEQVRPGLDANDVERIMFVMLSELHSHLPASERPMSLSDMSDDQAQRATNAVVAVIEDGWRVAVTAKPVASAAFTAKRRRLGWSLRQVEHETGIAFSTLARFERGERTGARVAGAITTWLADVDPAAETLRIVLPSGVGIAEVRQKTGGYAVYVSDELGDYHSAWNLPTFESAVRNIMDVLWKGCLPFLRAAAPTPPGSRETEA